MFCFTFLLRLLYFWEICNSFSHAIRYSLEEAVHFKLIKPPPHDKTTDIPPIRQAPDDWTPTPSSTIIVRIVVIALLLIIMLIFKTTRPRKRNFTNTKQYKKIYV